MKICIYPQFDGVDNGQGGIRKVVEGQKKWLPKYGIDIVNSIEESDMVVTHATVIPNVPVGKPWVMHCQGLLWTDEYDWPSWSNQVNGEVIEAMRRADAVATSSDWVAQVLRRGMWLKPTTVYLGIDLEEWQGGSNGGYVLWNKTRVDPVCDPGPLDEAAKLLPDVKFISTFGKQASNVKLTGKIPFIEMRDLVKNAGVYLCTTRENMSIGTFEAMAAGVPLVGFAWGGNPEVIKHKFNGWLCPPGDYRGLAEGIRWAIANHDEISRNCKEESKQWSWENVMARYAAFYKQVMEKFEQRKQNPKVSVIITSYNLDHYLPGAIKSIQNQTLQNWELIVVDDKSSDNSFYLASEFAKKDKRIRVIRNPFNLHVSGAKNVGLSQAKGQYLMTVDADNELPPDALSFLSGCLDKDRALGIVYGGVKFVLPDGKPDKRISPDGISKWPYDFSFDSHLKKNNTIQSSALFRREVFERTGGYRRRFKIAEDADFWTRAISIGFVPKKVTKAPTLIYITRVDSLTHTEEMPDWTMWYPWARNRLLMPFGVATDNIKATSRKVSTFESPKISVVIPCGPGHEELLVDAIDSVEAQTFRQWECILVNDTGHELKNIPTWVKVIKTKGQVGPGAARNMGISVAKAPLFIPLDADDYLQPDALTEFYRAWQETGYVVYSQWWDDFGQDGVKVYDPPEYNPKLLITEGCLHAVTALYSVEDMAKVGGFDESIKLWEDWDLQIALASKGICETKINKPLFIYRQTTGKRKKNGHANIEDGKKEILTKWDRYWKGEELMACGGCGKRPASKVSPINPNTVMQMGGSLVENQQGVTILEYMGNSPNTITFRGNVTHNTYRFGNTPSHKQKYVYSQDVPFFLTLKGVFQEVKAAPAPVQPKPEPVQVPVPVIQSVVTPRLETEAAKAGESSVAVAEPEPEISVNQLKRQIDDMSREDMAILMSKEKAGSNRVSIIRILEKALKDA